MSDLLQICEIPLPGEDNRFPVMMEFPSDDRLLPILVSSTRSVLWVHKMKGPIIRAAIREFEDLGGFYREVVESLIEKGIKQEWGNSFPFSSEGLHGAIQYLYYYGLEDVELLVSDLESIADFDIPDVPIHSVDWLPPGMAVVVPQNKEFLGFVGLVSHNQLVSVVHNAARGVGIAWNCNNG